MPKPWIEPEPITPPQSLVKAVGGHPLVAETLARRGITSPETAQAFLDPARYKPAPPSDLPGMEEALNRTERAILNGETILVWGDFDVDGQTSTTLLVESLHNLGAKVVYHIPLRATEGHGIKPAVLDALLSPDPPHPHPFPTISPDLSVPSPRSPSLLLTCDTGITEVQAVELAHSMGLDVIITDHHELPEQLPKAEAILNPHLLPENHPLGGLPGVGVAYKLVEGLYERFGQPGSAARYLDLAALGIVADVAVQSADTRYLLQRGLQVLREQVRPGLASLYEIARINPLHLDEGHIGFGIGPRLNALGRLSDANSVVEFFTTQDLERAQFLAFQLDRLNQERRQHTERVTQDALDILRLDPSLLDYAILVLAQPGWPKGVIGIVASRLVEIYGKPTLLLNIGEDGIARGSARSVEGLHLTEAIAAQSDLLIGFGGHAGAAGLSLQEADIPEFRTRLSRTIKAMTAGLDLTPSLQIDAFLPLPEVTLDFVDELERLAPFGAGNPSLTIASRGLKVVSKTEVGREGEHLRLVLADRDGNAQDVLWWFGAGETIPAEDERFDLAFHASANTFQGERRLQLEWVDYRPTEDQQLDVQEQRTSFSLDDFRMEGNPLSVLDSIRSRESIQVWAEGEVRSKVGGLDRQSLIPAKSLAIWTAPPSFAVLKAVLKQVKPKNVYAFGISPDLDTQNTFLIRLTGLVKHVINQKDGLISLATLAAGMAHNSQTVEVGLRWLEAKGMITVVREGGSGENGQGLGGKGIGVMEKGGMLIKLSWEQREARKNLLEVENMLKAMLEETAAYRKYFRNADLESVFTYEGG